MPIFTAKIRDMYMINNEPVAVLSHPRINGVVIREHINLRQRDLAPGCSIKSVRVGSDLQIKCEIGEYLHNGVVKACARNVTSIKSA